MTASAILSEIPEMDLVDCRPHLIWAHQGEVEKKYEHVMSSFEEVTVCWLILRGAVRLDGPQGRTEAGAGDWLFPGTGKGTQHFSPRSAIISIRFQLLLPGGEPLYPRLQSRLLKSADFPALETSAMALVACFVGMGEKGSFVIGRSRIPLNINLHIESAFYQWLAVYMETMQAVSEPITSRTFGDTRVHQALQLLDHFPMRERFSEVELTRQCGLSVNQLNNLFKQETGLTPFQYYDRQRLKFARHALRESDLQIKEIAFELGFSSSPHFTNWFKQREGVGPRVFRNL